MRWQLVVLVVALSKVAMALCRRGALRATPCLVSTAAITGLGTLLAPPQPCLAQALRAARYDLDPASNAQQALDLMHYGQRSVFDDTTVAVVMLVVGYKIYFEIFKWLASK